MNSNAKMGAYEAPKETGPLRLTNNILIPSEILLFVKIQGMTSLVYTF